MIKTKRLILRAFEAMDLEFLFTLNNDKEVNQYRSKDIASYKECAETISKWQEDFEGFFNVYAIIKDQKPIGMMFIVNRSEDDVEIGYRLIRSFWRQGYAYESAHKLLEILFTETELTKAYAETHRDNIGSIGLLLKLGYKEISQINGGRQFKIEKEHYEFINC